MNHITNRKDNIALSLNIGCNSIAAKQYFLTANDGTETPIFAGPIVQNQNTNDGLLLSSITNASNNAADNDFKFMAIGTTLMFTWHLSITTFANLSGPDSTLTWRLPENLLASGFDFTGTNQANGMAFAITNGSFIAGFIRSVDSSTDIIFTFEGVNASTTYIINVSGACQIGADS